MIKGAIISECGRFRYRLWRRWDEGWPVVAFVMLNPSTADAEQDDPTIRKCIAFAKRLEYGALEVVNLYAFRATDPKDLAKAGWPIGPDNNLHIATATAAADVICAWGANARGRQRPEDVLALLRAHGRMPRALALTDDGIPRHPLYLPFSSVPRSL